MYSVDSILVMPGQQPLRKVLSTFPAQLSLTSIVKQHRMQDVLLKLRIYRWEQQSTGVKAGQFLRQKCGV